MTSSERITVIVCVIAGFILLLFWFLRFLDLAKGAVERARFHDSDIRLWSDAVARDIEKGRSEHSYDAVQHRNYLRSAQEQRKVAVADFWLAFVWPVIVVSKALAAVADMIKMTVRRSDD